MYLKAYNSHQASLPLVITAASVSRSGPWIACHNGNALRDLLWSSAKFQGEAHHVGPASQSPSVGRFPPRSAASPRCGTSHWRYF